ncbi:diacylglycerol kinase [bacterium]|nr:diacylglycerol kinase family protein [Chloroflexi bacterium CFX6]RIL10976.1 MAG: diacylglycerol kinase [bacterium]
MYHRVMSFRHAFAGLAHVARTQTNARIHLVAAAVVVVLGARLGLPARDWALVALCIGLVLAAEAMNTAVEAVVDLASPDVHPLARVAKDAAAGAVLLTAMAAAAVGLLVLGPPLAAWLRG